MPAKKARAKKPAAKKRAAQQRAGRASKPRTSDTRGGAGGTEHRTDWQEPFLEAFQKLGYVSKAAEAAKVNPSTVYREIKRSPEFADQFEKADDAVTAALEAELVRRGLEGVEMPLVVGGQIVKNEDGTERTYRTYSDRLLIVALKARKPEKYRERLEVSGKVDVVARARKEAEELPIDELTKALAPAERASSIDEAREAAPV